ncbi:MAG: prephenate dehydrogenase/arogenate dehydrogenase family protein [Chloroflexota bacterium]
MRIGIAGLGLIGGSLAQALGGHHEITGHDIDRGTRDLAASAGIRMVERLDELLPADAVIVATPVAAVLPTLATLAPRAGVCVLIDVSSVRAPVESFVRGGGGGTARIVGMHPMAGRSGSGFAAADPALLAGRPFLIVPTSTADAAALALAGALARDVGGVPTVCSAVEHDRILALTSALPLALAVALSLTASEAVGDLAPFAGPGYRDTTRLADTPAELAMALLRSNAANAVVAIARLRTTLDELERAVAEQDVAALRDLLGRASAARQALR